MTYKVIHESHARFLTDSEYRILLSINMFQNVGKELISVDMIAKDCLMGEKTVDRALFAMKEKRLIDWDKIPKKRDNLNQWWNSYDINFELKLPRTDWSYKARLVDTRCFEGAPAWACWFVAACNSMDGFEDHPGKRRVSSVADYLELDRRTVQKYIDILTVVNGELYVMDSNFRPNGAMLFYKKRKVIKMIDICTIPENKKWGNR